jgi:hypothetical protein
MREQAAVRFGFTLAISAALTAAALSGARGQPLTAQTHTTQTFTTQTFTTQTFTTQAFTTQPLMGPHETPLEVPAPFVAGRSAASWSASGPQSGPHSGGAWRGLVWPPMSGGAVDRLEIASADGLQGPDGPSLLVGRFGDDAAAADDYGPLSRFADSIISRDWPGAVRLKTGAFGFDISPHAGVGRSGGGGAQDAGALLRFGRGLGDEDRAKRTRWFLFASTDQQTLGTGFLRNEDAWKRVGLGPDPGAAIADTRAGLAWRDGPFEASVGYLYREIKPRDLDIMDVQTTHESLVGFRLTFHPGPR